MVSFRKCILALTVLVLFAGLASAQVGGVTPLTCSTNVSVTPTLRAEGYTEQTGDITITCTGGSIPPGGALPLGAGAQIPAVNIQVFANTTITSRLLPVTGISNVSEALLLIDEPGTGLAPVVPGFGPAATQNVCATPNFGCTEYLNFATGTINGVSQSVGVAVDCQPGAVAGTATCPAGTSSTAAGKNVFQGLVNGNSVTFFGIPVLPPVTTGASRVFRITNVRVNATTLSGGSAVGATPVNVSISISGATSLLISNPTPTVGFVQNGLVSASTTASSSTNLNQCNSATRASINTLTFTENFGTAFKTRIGAQANSTYAGQGVPGSGGLANQNVPGTIYNSESNFVLGVPSGTAGLSDYGTRLKAQFNNVAPNVRLFVSTTNVNNNAIAVSAPAVPGGSAANAGTIGYAQLVSSETSNDGSSAGVFFPAVSSTDVPSTGNTPIVEIPVVNGSATAVWEVINTNPNAIDVLKFGVYTTYSSSVAQNSPAAGLTTVNLSFAATPSGAGTFTIANSATARADLPIPRFVPDQSTARNIMQINICRTILLYPYVTNIQGFDTGLAIANTSTDPFGTGVQNGSCDLNWYQGANNPAKTPTGTIGTGTVYTNLASLAVPGFNGYMIAVCSFQYAHGFAFISDLGARNLAMGYLALVIPDNGLLPGTGSRSASPPCQGISGCSSTGENEGH